MKKFSPIVAGSVRGSVLMLGAPISFWGGTDHVTGRIIDRSHPDHRKSVSGRILVVPSIRGSGGTPGTLALLLRNGVGPIGIVAGYPDINVMTGLVVAAKLYGIDCPFYVADRETLASIDPDQVLTVSQTGAWEQH